MDMSEEMENDTWGSLAGFDMLEDCPDSSSVTQVYLDDDSEVPQDSTSSENGKHRSSGTNEG